MASLEDILNAVSIPLEVGDLKFRLTGMRSARILALNRLAIQGDDSDRGDPEALLDATKADAYLDRLERTTSKQHDLLAEHMKDCLVEGDRKKVTGKWLEATFPQPVIQDLSDWFVRGVRPAWAGDAGK